MADFQGRGGGCRKNPPPPPEKTPAKSAKGIDDEAEIGLNGGVAMRSISLPANPFLQTRL